ncbi:putative signal transduction histidine kinase, phosphotransfer (Hpt) domain, HPT domain superfamily [Helianthus anomalus]
MAERVVGHGSYIYGRASRWPGFFWNCVSGDNLTSKKKNIADDACHYYKQVDSHVHQFKGSSSSIGAQRVTHVCIHFRNCCEEINLDG